MSPAAAMAGPLAGRHVLVTRPLEQAQVLAAAIAAEGGIPVMFPVLSIQALDDTTPLIALAARLSDYDLAVFVSANAIEQALRVMLAGRPWPSHLAVAAMGLSSQRALARFGIEEVIAPTQRFDSEALLALPELQEMAGKRVLVLRGDGGRELLGDTLKARGAQVEYVTCYRRSRPDLPPTPLLQLWQTKALDALILTSSEGLRNLFEILDATGRAYLVHTSIFVPHGRIADEAQRLGCKRVITTSPGDDGLLAGLKKYFENSASP